MIYREKNDACIVHTSLHIYMYIYMQLVHMCNRMQISLPEYLVHVGVLWKIMLFVVDCHYYIVCMSFLICDFWLPFWCYKFFHTFLAIHHVFQPLSSSVSKNWKAKYFFLEQVYPGSLKLAKVTDVRGRLTQK